MLQAIQQLNSQAATNLTKKRKVEWLPVVDPEIVTHKKTLIYSEDARLSLPKFQEGRNLRCLVYEDEEVPEHPDEVRDVVDSMLSLLNLHEKDIRDADQTPMMLRPGVRH